MKKTFLLFVFALVLSAFQWTFAAPLRNIPVRLTQPDGQIIECFASGDEFYNYVHDANGFTIVKGEGGYYCYAMHDSQGKVVASPYRVNSVDPAEVGLQPYVKISEQEYLQRRHEREQHIKPIKRPANRELNHGRYNNLVVFIRFAGDTYHTTPFSTVDSMFNASNYESISLHNYYHHTSYNQLDLRSYFYPEPDGQTILSYEDIYPKEYYMPYDPVTNPMGYHDGETADREFSMLERAIYYVADQVPDTLDLDYNDDGMVDNVVFVIKGQPGEWASLLWPHRWCIYDRYVPLHDLQVYDFNLQLEIGGYFNVSTLCHEMFHSLGAPDLYHYSGGIDPVGSWDLMCGTTEPPQQMSTYMKYKYGHWVDEIPVINPEPDAFGNYELESVSWEGGRRNGYMIPVTNDQYFFVEYRDKSNIFESQIPGSGMLIYRIDTRFDGNAGWNGNDYLDEVYLFRPGGTPDEAGDLNHAYFSEESGRTCFNYNTDPYPFINNQPYQFYDPGFEITNISRTGDRMSFVIKPYGGEGSAPGPENFVAHVNSLEHQVELSWDANPYAGYYYVYRDGITIAEVTDTTFVHPYTEADYGFHIYSVLSVDAGLMHLYSAESKTWVILGNYETIHLSITSDSPYGTKGGELEVSYNLSEMKTEYLTIYEGTQAETDLHVPANTEITFNWNAGFDPESQGIHVRATSLNASGEETIFDMEAPASGCIATYTVADESLGLIPPQNVTATSDGQSIQLHWTVPTENCTFDIYRGDRKIASQEGYTYLDDKIMRSGTYRYHVETTLNGTSTWNPDQSVYASVMNYYCEPPQNLEGTYSDGHVELSWEAPEFFGQGLFAYDDNQFIEQIGSSNHKWGIKMEPEYLAHFAGHPLTHIELFDCSTGHFTFTIYNGELANNNTTLYVQERDMEASYEFVRFALDEPVDFDPTLPLWICVATSGTTKPIPCCNYVGEGNSCLLKQGAFWKPATEFGQYVSWMLRGYTSPMDGDSDFTYNVYWGPEEGGEEQLVLGYETLTATQANYNTTENQRYNVTAFWNGRETELSNTVYLGPSVGIEETTTQDETLVVYPNPVSDQLTLQGEGIQYVRLITVTGACVFEKSVKHDAFGIDMTALPQGLYFLSIQTEEGMSVKKVVKK
jgi:M6 family metalloprotease-like protein